LEEIFAFWENRDFTYFYCVHEGAEQLNFDVANRRALTYMITRKPLIAVTSNLV